jgi:hypothetical protein
VQELQKDGLITVEWCSTVDQVADCLTKPLVAGNFLQCRNGTLMLPLATPQESNPICFHRSHPQGLSEADMDVDE